MEEVSTKNAEVEQIVEKLLKLQEENRKKIRPGQAKSAPSTPVIEQRGPRPYVNHDVFRNVRIHASESPTRVAILKPSLMPPYLHPLPAHCPVPQSYQPMYLKSANFSKSNRHGLKHLSRSTPTMSPSGSPPHSDSEGGQSHISRRTKKFLRRFRSVSHTEKVVNYYACAIVSDILLQGTLYITENYFAFYSNIFGYVNRTLIPIAEVSSIQKEKTAKFIPNAVGLHTIDGKTYVFSSLISRDATYKFMTHMWKKSRNPTDSDMEANIPPPEEQFSDSGSISGDSAVEDNIDYPADTYDSTSVTDHTAPVWHKISPMAIADIKPLATSGTNSENDSTYTTPETCLSSSSVNGVRSTLDPLGTSASESEVTVKKRENITPKVVPSSGKTNPEENRKKPWSVRTNIFNTVINLGVAPFRAVKDGLQEVAFMPNNSALLIASSSLVLLLLLSALFMIYKVETLSYQLNEDTLQYGDLYEEVLRMQQKIHAATAKEIESTLNQQIRQLVTVKQSLEALIFLLDSNRSSHSSPVSENSY